MQKEDLIKRLRLFATITTTLFVVLIVTLLIQFGFIAYYRNEINRLHESNEELTKTVEDLEHNVNYYQSGGYEDRQINH